MYYRVRSCIQKKKKKGKGGGRGKGKEDKQGRKEEIIAGPTGIPNDPGCDY